MMFTFIFFELIELMLLFTGLLDFEICEKKTEDLAFLDSILFLFLSNSFLWTMTLEFESLTNFFRLGSAVIKLFTY